MSTLVVKNISPDLHERLKARARGHHRSLTQEVVTILEASAGLSQNRPLPPLRKGKFPLTEEWLNQVKREGLE